MMTQPLPYCTYVLFSDQDRMLYVGFSSNLENRLMKHNSGGVKSTAYRRPLKLIFCEFYLFEKDARNRESYFKTTAGKKALKYMLRSTLHTLGYAEKVAFILRRWIRFLLSDFFDNENERNSGSKHNLSSLPPREHKP